MTDYTNNLLAFVEEVLGLKPHPWQRALLLASQRPGYSAAEAQRSIPPRLLAEQEAARSRAFPRKPK